MDLLEGFEAHLIIIDRRTHHELLTVLVPAHTTWGSRTPIKPSMAVPGRLNTPETITLTRPLSDEYGDLRPMHVNEPDTTKKRADDADTLVTSDEVPNLITRREDTHPGRERTRDTTKIGRMDDGTVSSHGDHLSGGADWPRARFRVPRSFHAPPPKGVFRWNHADWWRWGESNPRPTADPEVFSGRILLAISQPPTSCRPAAGWAQSIECRSGPTDMVRTQWLSE